MKQLALLLPLALEGLVSGAAGAGEIRGRVLVEGKPAAGVTVSVFAFEDGFAAARREARQEGPSKPLNAVTTRPDGSFAAPVATAGAAVVRVGFSGAPVAPVLLETLVDGAGEDLGDVRLPKARLLAGRVLDDAGGPVVGAAVTLRAGPADGPRASVEVSVYEAVPQSTLTKADGSFRFEAAVEEGNSLRVEAPGFATLERSRVRAGAVARPLTLSVAQPRPGVVMQAGGRAPAAGALVRYEGQTTTRWIEAGKDGSFVVEAAPREAGRLVADGGERGQASLPVAAGTSEPVVLKLVPAWTLVGRVVDATSGKPLAGVRLVAEPEDGSPHVARSGPDGRYAISGLAPERHRLKVADDHFVAWERQAPASGDTRTLDVPLVRGATLAGRVVNEDGAPVEGAVLRVTASGENAFRAFFRSFEGDAPVRSGRDGSFSARRLAPGDNQRLDVSHEEYEARALGGISLTPGGTYAAGNVVLPRGIRLRGIVKDPDGRPLAGVDVTLSRTRSLRAGRGGMQFEMIQPGAEVERETGPDGRFEFRGLKPGDYALAAKRAGFSRASLDPVKVADASAEPVELTLRPGATISGVVRDEAGAGVSGWFVIARSPGARSFGPGANRTEEPTGPDGSFLLESLAVGETYEVQAVGSAGLGPRRAGVVAPADGIELIASATGQIRGQVVDTEGRPIPDFDVSYTHESAGGMVFMFRGGPGGRGPNQRHPFHAEDGAFVIEDVPAGRWRVEAFASGYQAGSTSGVVVGGGAESADVEVRLAKGGALSGRVLEARTGRPILDASVKVELSGAGPRMPRLDGGGGDSQAATDADGRYEIDGLAPGTWKVTASHPEWSEATTSVELKDAPAVADVRLGRGGSVGGVVVAASRPVAGAQVSLSPAGDSGFRGFGGDERGALTDAGGRFRFERLAPGRYSLSAALGEHSSAPAEAVLTGEEDQDVQLTLAEGALIRGVVRGLGDAQLAGVTVNAQAPDYWASTRTGPGGAFEFAGVTPGIVTLRANAGDFVGSTRSASATVTVGPSDTEVAAEIVFEQGFRVDGHVTRGGRPVPDAFVFASRDASGRSSSARTDEAGAYALEGLEAGSYTIMVSTPGSAPIRRDITISGDTSVDLEAPPARLSGSVVDSESGQPLGDVAVSIDDQSTGALRFFTRENTDSSGRFAFEDLEPRAYRLSFQKAAYQVETRDVTAGEDASVRIELRRGEGIALEARDGSFGTPLRGLMVRVLDAAGAAVFTGSVPLDSDGRGEVPALKPGVYELRAETSGYAPASVPGVAVPSRTLSLSLTPGGSLEIQAGAETLALPEPAGRLVGADGRVYIPNVFSSDGKIAIRGPVRRLDNVRPGRYTFRVDGGASREVTITEGGRALVALP